MKKQEFLNKLDKLNLDKNSYCIIASGSMLSILYRKTIEK